MEIKVAINSGAYMPVRAYDDDGGYDIKTPIDFVVPPRKGRLVVTGVHIAIPKGYVGFLKSKSGLNVKKGIVSEGVIDCGYTGSIVAKLYNHSDEPVAFKKGDKITQIVILPIPEVELVKVDKLDDAERGNNGFGSTGR